MLLASIQESGVKLNTMLTAARKQGHVGFEGQLRCSPESKNGPVITLKTGGGFAGQAALTMLCESLRNGVVLCDLLNIVLPAQQRLPVRRPTLMADMGNLVTDVVSLGTDTVSMTTGLAGDMAFGTMGKGAALVPDLLGGKALSGLVDTLEDGVDQAWDPGAAGMSIMLDVMDAPTVLPNLREFCSALTDPVLAFRMAPDQCLRPDDLRHYDLGTVHAQQARQKRVLKCLLELSRVVSNMDGCKSSHRQSASCLRCIDLLRQVALVIADVGPRLDSVNLGTLGAGGFFGELSLLPLAEPWRHKRTHTAMHNSVLYLLEKEKVEAISRRFPDLKNMLADHAEDYQSLSPLFTEKGSSSTDYGKPIGAPEMAEPDPLAHVHEALHQLDTKIAHEGNKLSALDRKVGAMDDKLEQILQLVGGGK